MINTPTMEYPQKKIDFCIMILYLEELVAFTEVLLLYIEFDHFCY